MKMTFTNLILQAVLDDPGVGETVRQWMVKEPDPKERIKFFAIRLAEDFVTRFSLAGEDNDDETVLREALLRLSLDRVNWDYIARTVLKEFQTPVKLAAMAYGSNDPPQRLIQAIHAYRAGLN